MKAFITEYVDRWKNVHYCILTKDLWGNILAAPPLMTVIFGPDLTRTGKQYIL